MTNARDKRYRTIPGAMAGLYLFILILTLSFLAPLLSPYDIAETDWDNVSVAPTFATCHWYGTDGIGRDLFVRTMLGVRISLLIGVCATAVSVLIGVSVGALAGYCGGYIDQLIMRAVDIIYCIPFIFFVIVLTVVLGQSLVLVFVAIGAVEWLNMSRIVRGQTLSVKERPFVKAAIAYSCPTRRILLRHIMPNVSGSIIVCATMTVPYAIMAESVLSFLGFGVQEPMTSLGVLVSDGSSELYSSPWALFFPAFHLAAVLLAFILIGDGVRNALDPKAVAK